MLKNSVSLALAAIALVGLSFNAANAQTTFSNTTPLNLPSEDDGAAGTANVYPSTINVTGLTGTITKVTFSLIGVSHTFPDDMAALVVGPGGQKSILFNGPGDGADIVNFNWTFDDAAATALPTAGALTAGTFRPSNQYPGDSLDAPAPSGPYATDFSAFNGTAPNGAYSLYFMDFVEGDTGGISGGWSVSITTTAVPAPSSLAVLAVPGLIGMGAMLRRRRR